MTAEVSHGMVLNQIGTVVVTTARPIAFDRYSENRGTGSFILVDPGTHFTCGAGMITDPVREAGASPRTWRRSVLQSVWPISRGARRRTKKPRKRCAGARGDA